MILPLLLAATVSAAAPAPVRPASEDDINIYRQPAHCPAVVQREVARQRTAFGGPPPAAEYAVLRSLDGCGVPTPVGYHPGYLKPGKADPTVRREDAPSHRR